MAIRHHAWIPGHFGGSSALCPDPLVIRRLSGIVLGSFSHFDGSLTSCLDPLVIRRLFNIVPGSPRHFGGSPASCPNPLIIKQLSGIVPRSPSHSGGSSASCSNPLFSGIVSSFLLSFPALRPDFLCFLRHRAWILYLSRKCIRFSLIFFGTVSRFL